MEKFKTIINNAEAEIVEKRSKFIANIYYVKSLEEVEEKLKDIKKKYFDSRHNCYAYRIEDEDTIIERASDDGEPSGTAGAPILNILNKMELMNVLVIVTRYFGGILLGTGGLVKAYSQATKMAIENAKFAVEENGILAEINLNYNDFDNFKYCCRKSNVKILDIEYLNNIRCKIEATNGEKEELIRYVNKRRAIINIFVQSIYLYDDHFTLIINASKKPLSIDNIPLDDIETAFEGETGASEGCSSLNAPAPPYQKPAEMLVFPLFMRVFSIFNLCKSCCFLRSFCI